VSFSGISGDKTQTNLGDGDYWIVKTDPSGVIEWDKRFGGNLADHLTDIVITPEGDYVLGGYSRSGVSGDKTEESRGQEDFWVVKVNEVGIKIWDKRYGGSLSDKLYKLTETPTGDILLAGESASGSGGDKSEDGWGGEDLWMVLIDEEGTKLWDKRYGTNSEDYFGSSILDNEGNYVFALYTRGGAVGDKTHPSEGTLGNADYWIIKTSAEGTKLWDSTYGGNGSDEASSIIQLSGGGYLIGGSSKSYASANKSEDQIGSWDYWIIKISESGVPEWDKTTGGTDVDRMYHLHQTLDGNYLLGGGSQSGASGDKSEASWGDTDYWIVSLDDGGTKLWDKSFGGDRVDEFQLVVQTSTSAFLLAGYSNSNITGDKSEDDWGNSRDYWILLTTPECETVFTLYNDADGDGFGAGDSFLACSILSGTSIFDGDCNDANPAIHPGKSDMCNDIDDNCNGVVDENAITATVSPSGTVNVCDGSSIVLTANGGEGITYQWKKNSINISGKTNQTYTVKKTGDYSVYETNDFECSSTSAVTTVIILESPEATITPLSGTDLCFDNPVVLEANSGTGYLYQWKKGSNILSGETNQSFSTTKKGTYKVNVTHPNGCSKTSSGLQVTKSCKFAEKEDVIEVLNIYPNPTNGELSIEIVLSEEAIVEFAIINVLGREVYTSHPESISDAFIGQFDLSRLPSGTYFLRVTHGRESEMRKVVIENCN
jgi:hypothetical protein